MPAPSLPSRIRLMIACLVASWLSACQLSAQDYVNPWKVDGDRAFRYLEQICAIGPRISGTVGMQQQQELIDAHFTNLGAEVRYQEFDVAHPETGEPVRMRNMIVSWNPDASERLLACCHYDTRPRPDQEPLPFNRNKPFIGANDGGSGVAVLMEMGHHMQKVDSRYGIDFVFFDGEELVYDRNDKYFLGSEYFANQYRERAGSPPKYVAGVLLDLVASKNLRLYYEVNSLRLAPEVTRSIWETAQRLGVREFIARRKHEVLDDHLALNRIGGIPTADIIDFDYPYWHRRNDLPAACSGESMAKVANVVLEWLSTYDTASAR